MEVNSNVSAWMARGGCVSRAETVVRTYAIWRALETCLTLRNFSSLL